VLSGNEAILAHQILGFDGLSLEVQRLTRLSRARNQRAGTQDTRVARNLEQCVQSARQFVSSASTIISSRTTIAGESEPGDGLSETRRNRITNWIPDASSTIDEDGEHDSHVTSSTFSQIDDFTDDVATIYNDAQTADRSVVEGPVELPRPVTDGPDPDVVDAQTADRSVVEGPVELPRPVTDGPDPDVVVHLIKYWKKSARSKFDAGDYAAAEIYLGKVIKKSEAIHGAQFEGRPRMVQLLVLALSQQGKWDETHALLQEKFHRREETMEQIATDCREQGNWEEAEKVLDYLWNNPTEPNNPRSGSQKMRLKQALAEVYFGKKDYPNAEKWCHLAVIEIKANVGMEDPLFFGAIYLLAEVYKANGDIEEMEAYRALLPLEFCRMIPWTTLIT
jgi:tetratricopeptide (TPR) repeat protein